MINDKVDVLLYSIPNSDKNVVNLNRAKKTTICSRYAKMTSHFSYYKYQISLYDKEFKVQFALNTFFFPLFDIHNSCSIIQHVVIDRSSALIRINVSLLSTLSSIASNLSISNHYYHILLTERRKKKNLIFMLAQIVHEMMSK